MELVEIGRDIGALGIALYLVFAFMGGKLHSDKAMQREINRGDRLEGLLLTALQAGERTARVAERKVFELDDPEAH